MKLKLNPTKPIYLDKKNRIIRCGNFPETGKEIEYDNDNFPNLFKKMEKFIDRISLQNFAKKEYSLSKKEFDDIIDYLLNEKFIITDNEYNGLIDSDRYSRQNAYFYMVSDKVKSLEKYKNKKILILGLGGIGSIVSELLVRAGFNQLIIVDFDKVEKSNLIRQTAYYEKDIGKYKIDILSKRLNEIDNNCIIEKYNKKILAKEDIENDVRNVDFVICTLDKPIRKIRRIINEVCIKLKKPVIFSGFSEHVGMIGPFVVPGKTACLECNEQKLFEQNLMNVESAPSYGPLCNIIASIVANEVINYYVKYNSNNLKGCTLMFNMINYSTDKIEWLKNPNCKKCGDIDDSKKFE